MIEHFQADLFLLLLYFFVKLPLSWIQFDCNASLSAPFSMRDAVDSTMLSRTRLPHQALPRICR